MSYYCEIYKNIDDDSPITEAACIETAIDIADENGYNRICEIGGSWDEWERCDLCDEFFPLCELNDEHECENCEMQAHYHGF